MLQRTPAAEPGHRTLTFTLPAEWAGRVSVVGNFNDWTPGALVLSAVGEVAEASVVVPNEYVVVFRYLGEGGHWFDEPEADHVDGGGSVVLEGADAAPSAPAGEEDGPAPDGDVRTTVTPAERAVEVSARRRAREEKAARKAAAKAQKASRKLADKVAKAGEKQKKAAARMAKEKERAAVKAAKKAGTA